MSTGIEWTDKTWNPVIGCAKVSPGCKHCYAETVAAGMPRKQAALGIRSHYLDVLVDRNKGEGKPDLRWNGHAKFIADRLADPLSWRKPARVFVNSMSDLFHEDVTFEQVAAIFGVMAATPRHTYQVLTKRPARMLEFFRHMFGLENTEETVNREASDRGWVIWDARAPRGGWPAKTRPIDLFAYPRPPDMRTLGKRLPWVWPLPNVWLGVSVENQAAADERIPLLLQAPAAVRFLSCEPLLGPVDLEAAFAVYDRHGEPSGPHCNPDGSPAIGWVIGGGESGPGARECVDDWLRSIGIQCGEAGVAFFLKQLGSRAMFRACVCSGGRCKAPFCVGKRQPYHLKDPKGGDPAEWPEDLRVRQWPREVAHAG